MGIYGQIFPTVSPGHAMDDGMIAFSPSDGSALRSAFGRFGTGVTIVTCQSPIGPLGMTANSFSSVSLSPALVLWSAALRSQRHDAFVQAQQFAIHVLGSDQRGLADHFATQGHSFSGLNCLPGPGDVPQLPGCLAVFHCEKYAVHPAGDHSLIIGEVTQAAERPGSGAGLLFDRGRFGSFLPQT